MPSIAEILAARGKAPRATTRGILTTDLPPSETAAGPTPNQPPQERALGTPHGELMDLAPLDADPATKAWLEACQGFESELCIMRDVLEPETCWLALRDPKRNRPLLLHRLPWLLWEHPETPRTDQDPY